MFSALAIFLAIYTAISLLVLLYFGWQAATNPLGPRKGNAKFIALLTWGLWFCVAAGVEYYSNARRPVVELRGVITDVHVIHADTRRYQAILDFHADLGGNLNITADASSENFKAGQRCQIRFLGDAAENDLLHAIFYAADGRQIGVFQSSWRLSARVW